MRTARILLADSEVLLMEAVTKLLEPEFSVVGTVANSRELLRTAVATKPDVIVLDVSLSGLSGLEAGRLLKASSPAIKLIYLTLNEDGDVIDRAFRIGASAYLLKSCTAAELLAAIRGVWLHPSYQSPFVTRNETIGGSRLRCEAGRKNPLRLTLRQREVLQLLVAGRSMKEVAFALRIKPRTVAYHKYRMMQDFNLNSSAALVRFALREQVA
jgi:DNA-binding NarL/FixJ family response regulator